MFAIIITAEEFASLIKSKKLMSMLEQSIDRSAVTGPQLTVVVYGKATVRDSVVGNYLLSRLSRSRALGSFQLNDLIFEAFETYRVQIRFVTNMEEVSFLVVQAHR